jgi:hypothetical protein
MRCLIKYQLCAFILTAWSTIVFAQKQHAIQPGEIWPDQSGHHIQAHGGGITKVGKTYYWYGEERGQRLDTNYRYVSCYSSKDLINWKSQGDVLALSKPDTTLNDKWVLERPKVYYNATTRKFVMYMHIDGNLKTSHSKYNLYIYARVIEDHQPEG